MSTLSLNDTGTELDANVYARVLRGSRRRCATCGRRRVVYTVRVEVVDEDGNAAAQALTRKWRCRPCSGL